MRLKDFFKRYKKQIPATLLLYTCFTLTGARIILLGSSILDLQIRIQESFRVTSRLLTSHSAGYLLGALVGSLLEKFFDLYLITSAALVGAGICVAIGPWLYSFLGIAVCLFCMGIGNSTFDIVAHSLLVSLWGRKVGNVIQLFHMVYAIGAQLVPFLARPFLLPLPDEGSDDYVTYYSPDDVLIMWPWMIVGTLTLVFGASLALFYLVKKASEDEKKDSESIAKTTKREEPYSFGQSMIACSYSATISFFIYSLESTVCGFAQAFAVKSAHKMDRQRAALLNSVFWASFTISKIIFVLLSSFFGENLLVNVFLVLNLIALGITATLAGTSELFLWVSIAALGFGASPLFSVAYSRLGEYIALRGIHTSIILTMAIIGESFSSFLVGTYMDEFPNFFLYYNTSVTGVFTLMTFLLPFFLRAYLGESKNAKDDEDLDEEEIKERYRVGSIRVPRRSIISIASRRSAGGAGK